MTVTYDEDTRRWRLILAPELRRIFDYLAHYVDDPWDLVVEAATDYCEVRALYMLAFEARLMGVIIPENLFADAERAVAQHGICEDYMLSSIRQYREEHYPAAA